MGLVKPGETCGLTGTGPGLDRQEAAGLVSVRFWKRTTPCFWCKPGPQARYPDPLLTLNVCGSSSLGTPSYTLTLYLHTMSHNHSLSHIPFGWHVSSPRSSHLDCLDIVMYLEAVIERVGRCTCRPRSSEFRHALRGCNGSKLEVKIKRTWRQLSLEFTDALEGQDRVNSETHFHATFRRGWRPWSCELGSCDHASLEMPWEVEMEGTQRYTSRG